MQRLSRPGYQVPGIVFLQGRLWAKAGRRCTRTYEVRVILPVEIRNEAIRPMYVRMCVCVNHGVVVSIAFRPPTYAAPYVRRRELIGALRDPRDGSIPPFGHNQLA